MGNIFNQDFRDFLRALNEEDGLQIPTIHKNDLIQAKKNAGRAKDKNDLENLI